MVLRIKGRWAAATCLGLAAFAIGGVAQAATPAAAVAASPDQKLAEAIAAKLGATSHLNGYQVDVTCEAGSVELNGTVKDAAQKLEIMKVVRSVKGVKQIVDRMSSGAVQPAQAIENTPLPTQGGPIMSTPQGLPVEAFNGSSEPPQAVSSNFGGHGHGGGHSTSGPPAGFQGGSMDGDQGFEGLPPGANVSYGGDPTPIGAPPTGGLYDAGPPKMPPYAWPTYAPHNNYSRVAYPQSYPASAFPFIGPFYPFPKVPPGYRSIKLEWEDGAWYYGRTATHRDWWRIRYW